MSAAGERATQPWGGQWVEQRLGVHLRTSSTSTGLSLQELVGLALRRNPRRAHLLVSSALGKHVPVDPRLVLGSGALLGALVADVVHTVDGGGATAVTMVVGYAETATALGHSVAGVLGAHYLHTTRREVRGVTAAATFEEEHSHASRHLLLPEDPTVLSGRGTLVLVDDELSTGRTIVNTIAALQALHPRDHYVAAALVDVRSPADREKATVAVLRLGARLDVVALATGSVELPPGLLTAAADVVADHAAAADSPASGQRAPGTPVAGEPVIHLGTAGWPDGVREGGRHGFAPEHAHGYDEAVQRVAQRLLDHLDGAGRRGDLPRRVLVLGTEELMHAPQRIAAVLADSLEARGSLVQFSTTTRSPVLTVDSDGYPVRTGLAFPAHDGGDPGGRRFAYNVAPGDNPSRRYDEVVLVLDDATDLTPGSAAHSPEGVLDQLAASCGRLTTLSLPSYRPDTAPRAALNPRVHR